jgi:hypothetical protein
MPTFRITESTPAVFHRYFEVVADTQEEADKLVLDGEVEPYDTEFDIANMDGEISESVELK